MGEVFPFDGTKTKRGGAIGVLSTLGLALAALTGCAAEVDPDALDVRLISAGRFGIESGRPELVERTDRIACVPGALFGVDYRIDVPGWRPGPVPIAFRWRHPELAVPSRKLWGTETAARRSNPEVGFRERSIEGRAIWHLEHPDERKNGRYEFAIVRSSDGETLASQVFEIEGC